MPTALVIGGGLAGLAAAAGLAQRGVTVTVLEARPRLGGRASSFVDPATGETIDNCQHVAMGCCTSFLAFCRMTGIERFFRTESLLHFIGPDGRPYEWGAAPLPAPLHLGPAFFRLGYLTTGEKLAAARGLRALVMADPESGRSFADWLDEARQPERVRERFWEVVLVSALSESFDRIDVKYARKVFVDGFLASADGWKVVVPEQPLDSIYGPVTDWLIARKGVVRLSTGVDRVELTDRRATGVRLRTGERLDADQIVVALPRDRVGGVVDLVALGITAPPPVESAPISSVHLWFDRPITELPHAVFVGKQSQWLFSRMEDRPHQEGSPTVSEERLSYYQVVVSASRRFLEQSSADAIEQVRQELVSVFPHAREAQLRRGRVVTEHKAVFSPLPGIDSSRPPQRTQISNLVLAGDWTRTGWPATMEGAVRSGFLAAEAVLEGLGRPTNLVAPPLPVARLSRWLLGL